MAKRMKIKSVASRLKARATMCLPTIAFKHVVEELDHRLEAILGAARERAPSVLVALRAHQRTTRTTIAATSIEFDSHSK